MGIIINKFTTSCTKCVAMYCYDKWHIHTRTNLFSSVEITI